MKELLKELLGQKEVRDIDITINVSEWDDKDINELAYWCGENGYEFQTLVAIDGHTTKRLIRIRA